MKTTLLIILFISSCQTTKYIKEVDRKNDVYYLYTHEERKEITLKRKEALEKVKTRLIAAHTESPSETKILLNLAQVSFLLGEYQQSADYCRKVLKMDLSSTQARLILAKNFLKQKKYELVKIIISQLGDIDTAVLANLKAQIAVAKEDYSEAFRILKTALVKHPNDPSLLMNSGLICLRFKQLQQAQDYFQKVLHKIKDHPDALLHLAVIDALHKNYQAAEKKYQQLLSQSKENPAILFNLSILKTRTHSYQEAMDTLTQYDSVRDKKVALRPEEQQYLRDLKKRLESQGKMTDEEIKKIAANLEIKQ